jgi:hypothetical protein
MILMPLATVAMIGAIFNQLPKEKVKASAQSTGH